MAAIGHESFYATVAVVDSFLFVALLVQESIEGSRETEASRRPKWYEVTAVSLFAFSGTFVPLLVLAGALSDSFGWRLDALIESAILLAIAVIISVLRFVRSS